jgi:hypothetical protein
MTEKGMDYRYKMKNESYNIFGTVPKSNTCIKTVERDHMDTTNTQIHDLFPGLITLTQIHDL